MSRNAPLYLSELIAQLELTLEDVGDLPVRILIYDGEGEMGRVGIATDYDENDDPVAITLMDYESTQV